MQIAGRGYSVTRGGKACSICAMQTDDDTLTKELSELVSGSGKKDFQLLEETFGRFCPFEAIGMVGQEIRHCHYLAYLLNPNNPHGFADGPLRAFLNVAAEASGLISTLDVYARDLASVTVRREWNQIDLLIELPPKFEDEKGWLIVVEAKIDAEEASHQLAKYAQLVADHYGSTDWQLIHLFLTPDGRLPSEQNQTVWAPMGFSSLTDALEGCLDQRTKPIDPSTQLLSAYIDMMRRHHLENRKLEAIAKRLWQRHPEALKFLAEHQPDPVSKFKTFLQENVSRLAESISTQLASNTLAFVPGSPSNYLRFTIDEWIVLPGLASGNGRWTSNKSILAFELKQNSRGGYSLYSLIGPGDDETRSKIHAAAQEVGGYNTWNLGKQFFTLTSWEITNNFEAFLEERDFEEVFEFVAQKIISALNSELGLSKHTEILIKSGLMQL